MSLSKESLNNIFEVEEKRLAELRAVADNAPRRLLVNGMEQELLMIRQRVNLALAVSTGETLDSNPIPSETTRQAQ